jgi:hypothetical protein
MTEPLKMETPIESEREAVDASAVLNGIGQEPQSEHQEVAEYLSPEFTERLSRHVKEAVRQAILNRGD